VIIPCFNEERYIEGVIHNLLAQSYPREKLEVFFVDGRSRDKTRDKIQSYLDKHPFFHLLDNPEQYVPQAMNRGIQAAAGEVIIRLDAHAHYPADYIEKLVFWLYELKADNVGGVWKTEVKGKRPIARAIAKVLSHPIGVGNAQFRIGSREIREADTVPFGCFRRDVFERFGYYDERLRRNQDIELNKRISRGGGKVFLIPEVECTYFARESLAALWKNNFANGEWVIRTATYTGSLEALSLRHFVPLFFALYWISLGILALSAALFPFWLIPIALLPGILYVLIICLVAGKISFRERNFQLFLPLIAAFFTLHFSYGLGSLKGLISMLRQ
jgi:glycosyltransferase involved in cell wall biosynthesis